ncbi:MULTISPECIES: hypothetical protein [Arenibacter]|uniref:hypothetical protein n=1 Tax=Arenibacter TaxID=178469 RepID=UPI000A3969A9|nr:MULTISPECIES: hypothetical protein [Arenibacter]
MKKEKHENKVFIDSYKLMRSRNSFNKRDEVFVEVEGKKSISSKKSKGYTYPKNTFLTTYDPLESL